MLFLLLFLHLKVNNMAASDLDPGLGRPESPEPEICEILGGDTLNDIVRLRRCHVDNIPPTKLYSLAA